MSALEWITNLDNIALIVEVLVALSAVASVITALTNTPKDDKVVAKVRSVLDKLSVLTHRDAEGTLKVVGTKSVPLE